MMIRSKFLRLATIVFMLSSFSYPAFANETYSAKVTSVVDGDTLKVTAQGVRQTVILEGVDCPELEQDFGSEAKKFTEAVCGGKIVTVESHGKDRHGRTIASVVLSDGVNLNQELVKRGLAWWSDKFAPDDMKLKEYHITAKIGHTGLWSKNNPIPPWIFRNGSKSVEAKIKPASD